MEYDPDFTRSFMGRTLALVRDYDGPLDATFLINCLLGLLVLPKEALINRIPTIPFESLQDWGINPESIVRVGRCDFGHAHPLNLRQLVKRLRNAVAHFQIEPHHVSGVVEGYSFRDRSGFHARVSLSEIRTFITTLAQHLEKQA